MSVPTQKNSELETGNSQPHKADPSSPPRLFGSWRRLYILVLAELALLIALFYLFMRVFE